MSSNARALKVGVFTAVGLALTLIAIFLIGDTQRGWEAKRTLTAKFVDVGGLKSGSPVRMGGVDVGAVSKVAHGADPRDPLVYVTMSIAKGEAARIKPDTKATVAGKGLLGDKMIVLEGGDPKASPAPDGSEIYTDLDAKDLMARLDDMSKKADQTMEALKRTIESLADPQMADDLKGSVKALRTILEGVANENGAAHKLIFDAEEGKRVDRILANLEATSAHAARASADAEQIAARARSGPGLVHTLVYDPDLASGTSGTMVELHKSLQALRTGNGLGHALVYGDDTSQHMMGNMSAMTDDLRAIVADMKAGRGTIGALLVDPTIYEDVKSLVGNVERNQVLRSLVRYSIKKNEEAPHATVTEKPQPSVTPNVQR